MASPVVSLTCTVGLSIELLPVRRLKRIQMAMQTTSAKESKKFTLRNS